jgi:hypothetical protein
MRAGFIGTLRGVGIRCLKVKDGGSVELVKKEAFALSGGLFISHKRSLP